MAGDELVLPTQLRPQLEPAIANGSTDDYSSLMASWLLRVAGGQMASAARQVIKMRRPGLRKLTVRKSIACLLFGGVVTWLAGAGQAFGQADKSANALPNIIIIYADDLGIGDLSCYNADCAYTTPRLDRMAREGIRFTDAHSPSTICSPSRYGLYSGQQIFRSTGRGGGAFEGPGGPSYLKPGTLTIAQMLQAKGYRTGVFGKWHVGLTWLDENGKRLGEVLKTRC